MNHNSQISLNNCPQEEVELWLELRSYFFQGTNTLIVWTIALPRKTWKATLGTSFLSAFQAATQASAFGFWHSKLPAFQNHSMNTRVQLFCFTPLRAKPWKQPLKTHQRGFPRKEQGTVSRADTRKIKIFSYNRYEAYVGSKKTLIQSFLCLPASWSVWLWEWMTWKFCKRTSKNILWLTQRCRQCWRYGTVLRTPACGCQCCSDHS